METVTYSDFRKNLKDYLKQVNNDKEPLIVTNKNPEDNVVVMSKEDYDSIIETLTINSNDYLMNKLARGDQQFKAHKFKQHELIEDNDND